MAEVKNAFIKSKMNKDLDSRLLPSGEYRDGQNIQVSKSEGEDVGALENALGNVLATNFNQQASIFLGVSISEVNLKSIGMYTDVSSSNVFVFLTDYDDVTYNSTGNLTYNPHAKNFIFVYNTITKTNPVVLVQGAFLNFSQSSPLHGINLLENLLFWTDNRNQPRKINWDTALNTPNASYYTSEDTISVAKYNPYQVIDLYYEKNSIPYTSMQDVVSDKIPTASSSFDNPFKNKPQGNQIIDQNGNNADWPGDPDYLEDKFVRFSYRFKFTDGEYSIMAPFTQPAFIPKQDGYFLGTGSSSDEDDAFRSAVVRFMENKVNNVGLFIPLPYAANEIAALIDVQEIDILYKESEGLTVKVLDSIDSGVFSLNEDDSINSSKTYIYQYQSRKPYKTLPESEIIRVFDRVPVKALGQEVISNRIVYSNFQDKHTPPVDLNYNVAANEKYNFNNNTNGTLRYTSEVEYPMHTLKQNRNYQVGFILSDRYGRQSTVILSPVDNVDGQVYVEGGITYSGSTFYHPYTPDPASLTPAGTNNVNSWVGDSLKVIINGNIPEDTGAVGYPGLWNGDSTSINYNPLGWYSYKVVVKQTEQDYYNVYLPGILNGYPDYDANSTPPDLVDTIAHITLLGDNINKVPRNLTEVGPEQKQYGSEVKLFGKVTPERLDAPIKNIPYYPSSNAQSVITVGMQDNLFADANNVSPYPTVYQSDSNPYMARISQNSVPIGSLQSNNLNNPYKILLGVFETAPVESFLDIFYETSTSGLVSEYNEASSNIDSDGFDGFNWRQKESTVSGTVVAGPFSPTLPGLTPTPIASSVVKLTKVERNGLDITSNWTCEENSPGANPTQWQLTSTATMYYGLNDVDNNFKFIFEVTDNGTGNVNTVVARKKLINVSPTFTSPSEIPVTEDTVSLLPTRNVADSIYTCTAENGVATPNFDNAPKTKDLTYSIVSQTPDKGIRIVNNSEAGTADLFQDDLSVSGLFNVVLRVEDSGEASADLNLSVVFGKEQLNDSFGSTENYKMEGLQSTGVYWANDYSNVVDNPPAAVSSAKRAVYSTLELNTPIDTSDGKQEKTEITSLGSGGFGGYVDYSPSGSGQGYTWKNTNLISKAFKQSLDPSGNDLQAGTAYIKLDFVFKPWKGGALPTGTPNGQYGGIWPCYLQYRAAGTSNWTNAIDIEGNTIQFGRTQRNVALDGNALDNVNYNLGVVVNNNESEVRPNQSVVDTNAVQSTTVFPGQNEDATSSTASFVFAFGKDQSYNNAQNNKFGDYRLLIRHPQDVNSSGSSDIRAIPNPTEINWNLNNPFDFMGAMFINSNVYVNFSFGDFYYNSPANPDGQSRQSYAYSVTQNASASDIDASNVSPTGIVFAREWAYKYVTQFYTDAELSIPWVPTQAGAINWHCYSGRANDINSTLGSENSNNNQIGSNVVANNLGGLNGLDQRRWVAQFDSNGKKLPGTSVPSTGIIS
jgi:hypothetical protein